VLPVSRRSSDADRGQFYCRASPSFNWLAGVNDFIELIRSANCPAIHRINDRRDAVVKISGVMVAGSEQRQSRFIVEEAMTIQSHTSM